MMDDPLERPVWHSLAGPLARFAAGQGRALRFHPQVGPLAAADRDDDEGLAALAALVPADGALYTMQAVPHAAPPGIAMERRAAVQMIAGTVVEDRIDVARIMPLTHEDAPEMLALARLTEPGPFELRTLELGQFWGIKADGQLVAMAGERLHVPGHAEVSGVCTHPDFRGHGYARALMLKVMAQIRERGETPFLTSYAHNTGAIALYERIGFRLNREMTISVLTRQAG